MCQLVRQLSDILLMEHSEFSSFGGPLKLEGAVSAINVENNRTQAARCSTGAGQPLIREDVLQCRNSGSMNVDLRP